MPCEPSGDGDPKGHDPRRRCVGDEEDAVLPRYPEHLWSSWDVGELDHPGGHDVPEVEPGRDGDVIEGHDDHDPAWEQGVRGCRGHGSCGK